MFQKRHLCTLVTLFLFVLNLNAEHAFKEIEAPGSIDEKSLVADSFDKRKQKRKERKKHQVLESYSWKPFFVRNNEVEPEKGYFFSSSLGVGFLRFAGVKGQCQLISDFTQTVYNRDLQGRLNYTRTPLVECDLGAHLKSWLSIALAYQHQGVIDVSSNYQAPTIFFDGSITQLTNLQYSQFLANLRLDAVFLKGYLRTPFALVFKRISMSSYLGLGAGVCWQSWSNIRSSTQLIANISGGNDQIIGINNSYLSRASFSNKYSANFFYTIDTGINLRSIFPNIAFAVQLGCKYNAWGQARSMGKLSQQQNLRVGLWKPIHIRTVYQFAPYLGVQWNY